MKNHVMVDGKLLQANKKFSALKERQKIWIYGIAQKEYENYIAKYKKQPRKKGKDFVIGRVSDQVIATGIWIPGYELANAVGKFIDRRNRRTDFALSEENELIFTKAPVKMGVQKPTIPKTKFADCAEEVKTLLLEKLGAQIRAYIIQTKKLPKGKVRDGHIKTVLNGFHAKQYKKYGSKVQNDESLIAAYEPLADELYADFRKNSTPIT